MSVSDASESYVAPTHYKAAIKTITELLILGIKHSHSRACRQSRLSSQHVRAMAPPAVTAGCGSLVQGPVGADAAALPNGTAFSDEAAWLASGRSPISQWVRSGSLSQRFCCNDQAMVAGPAALAADLLSQV